jgi:SAM-dependent methyltransferase
MESAMNIRVPKFSCIIDRVPFPADVRDGAAWDRFWQEIISDEKLTYPRGVGLTQFEKEPCRSLSNCLESFYAVPINALRHDIGYHRFRDHLSLFDRLGYKHILCGGNGISILPYMCAHQGFTVTAVDISPTAVRYSQAHPAEEEFYLRFFTLGLQMPDQGGSSDQESGKPQVEPAHSPLSRLEQLRQIVRRANRPGGSIQFEARDLFEYEPGDEIFDAIILQNLVEHFSERDQHRLAERLYRCLARGGILIVESQCLALDDPNLEFSDAIEGSFEQVGFLFHLKDAYRWKKEQYQVRPWQIVKGLRLTGRGATETIEAEFTERAATALASDLEQLRHGRKLVIFQYAR